MTEEQQKLSRKFIAYRTVSSMWFVSAIWLYFYRLYINDQQVGILDALAFAIGLFAEVPSGALADKFGRDRLARVGLLFGAAGMLVQGFGSSFMEFVIGQAILMVGMSFISGADEALFFEKLKFSRGSTDWRKLVAKASQIALVGTMIATVAGGFLYGVDPRLPWILNGLAFLASALLIWPIKDERPRKPRQKLMPELYDYLHDIKTGFAQFRLPHLWVYVPFIVTAQALFYTSGYGLLRLVLLDRFDFSTSLGAIAVASSSLITIGLLAYIHKNADTLSERKVLAMIGLGAVAGLLFSVFDVGMWGYGVILAFYAGEYLSRPFMSEVLNTHAPEDQRATVLSVASFLKSAPYVALAPLIGYLNVHDQLEYFLVGWAVLTAAAVAFYLAAKKKDDKIALAKDA